MFHIRRPEFRITIQINGLQKWIEIEIKSEHNEKEKADWKLNQTECKMKEHKWDIWR